MILIFLSSVSYDSHRIFQTDASLFLFLPQISILINVLIRLAYHIQQIVNHCKANTSLHQLSFTYQEIQNNLWILITLFFFRNSDTKCGWYLLVNRTVCLQWYYQAHACVHVAQPINHVNLSRIKNNNMLLIYLLFVFLLFCWRFIVVLLKLC